MSATGATNTVDFQNPIGTNAASRTIQVDNGTASTDAILSGAISGTGGIIKTGAGLVSLTATNTNTGITTINAGVLSVATIGNGGPTGSLSQASNIAGNLVLGGGTLQYTGATASTDRSYTLTNATTSFIEITTAGTTLTISGASANNTGGLTKIGPGTLTLSGNNLHTGTTTVSAGTLKLGAADRIANTSALVVDGTFDMNGFSETVASLAGAGTVTSSAAGTLTYFGR
ncbi:MAG: autotransporter-associated beta strand repeat-containing protein [Chitinophagaceae bacterium]|nr:autotransporter-associated beta strand repeat-containing protein [Chitinophagaceae bacterium]